MKTPPTAEPPESLDPKRVGDCPAASCSSIFIEPGYSGREVNAVLRASESMGLSRCYGKGDPSQLHVGSVEWVESVIGPQIPDFYPTWTKGAWHRRIMQTGPQFIKSASKYKKFEAFWDSVYLSGLVTFTDEWRHYCAGGKSLCSWWYQGDESTCAEDPNGPPLPFGLPSRFCGAIDIGRLDSGEIALVEVQHPYAIGWYGEQGEAHLYLDFLLRGWQSLKTNA